jgi:hypothetical protein
MRLGECEDSTYSFDLGQLIAANQPLATCYCLLATSHLPLYNHRSAQAEAYATRILIDRSLL